MTKSELSIQRFKEGYNCAQSVISTFAEQLNITQDFALKLSTGFGGGMGRQQEVCGAVSAGILVLSLLHGCGECKDKYKQEQTYAKVRELITLFVLKHETIHCKKLLGGCELLTAEGQERFKMECLAERCHCYVKDVVEILEEIA